jgi:hypothetical protein
VTTISRLHGRHAILYLQGSGNEAQPFSNAAEYGIDVDFDTVDVSVLGDDWASTIRGQAKWSGTFSGPYETGTSLAWDAMMADTERKFYLYPNKNTMAAYYYGSTWATCGIKGGVSAAVTFSAKLTGVGAIGVKP